MKIKSLFFVVLILSFALASCGEKAVPTPVSVPATEPVKARAIILGDISDDPAR